MTDKKISDLALLSAADLDPAVDYLPIVDPSEAAAADQNKRIFPSALVNANALSASGAVGSEPSKIPLNQYLGTMAYLDADNVSYSDAGTNVAEQNLAVNRVSVVTISADTTLTTTVPRRGSAAFVIVITSGTTSRTVTFGTGFKAVGTLATGTDAARRFVFQFISDGTNLLEVSRTAAITY